LAARLSLDSLPALTAPPDPVAKF